MRPMLGVALQCLLLLLPLTALPRKGGIGGGLSPAEELEITFSKELGLGEEQREKEDEHIYEGAEPNLMALTSKVTGATHLLKSDKPGDDVKGAKCHQLIPEEAVFPVLGSDSSLPPWSMGGLEGPVCTVKMGRRYGLGQSHLEVVGVLTSYESDFLKMVRHSSWDQGRLETFGICPAGETHSALLSLKHISAHLADPGENRFLVLHLEEVKWDAETKLRFKLAFQEDVGLSLGELQSALLVFYPGSRERKGSKAREKLLAAGEGLHQKQALCLSRDTRYLLLGASVMSAIRSHGQLSFDVSLAIRRPGDGGSLLPPLEAQQLLFGADEKCFTRMTPALLLLVKPRCEEDTPSPSSFLSVGGVLETVPYPQPSSPTGSKAEERASNAAAGQADASSPAPGSHDQFLGSLTRFVSRVLSPSGEPPAASGLHHWLDFKTMETLPHQLLNLSEQAALERLVQSDEPLVLLFPQNSQALLEQQFGHWRLEGSLLQLLLEKFQAVIQELREIPAFQANTDLFQHLLAFCYYPLGSGSSDPKELPRGHRKLHTLLLLKVLQTVRAHWQEKRKVSRQNRSAGPQACCRLQELTVDLHYEKFIVVPKRYIANNCEGPCRFPLSTRIPDYSSHTVLLMGMQERGAPLRRSPCCVPVKYSDKEIIRITTEGIQVTMFPNMVAEECGCR
ncbi:muellerian-inhibiting factor isoform X2 [Dermochelys coriacea]|uniref:muellerian-inhibiting factor isoform X2 n=1 Tax=Dermochelys coriacea TaxID=27794 RepID=UPI0018E89309|nr:muellerian-inhibiting factor isoform X2 [Dermochelys coriacea]